MHDPAPVVALSDSTGSTASVAPSLGGRVLSFVPAGASDNLFWNGPAETLSGWFNHGGEKTWIGPQGLWSAIAGTQWPPPQFFDQIPFTSEPVAPSSAQSVSLRSTEPGKFQCPFSVERNISLTNGTLAVEAQLVPRADGKAVKTKHREKPLPEDDDGWHVWSVAQVKFARRAAIRTTPPWRYNGPGGDGSPLRQVWSDGVYRLIEIADDEAKNKIFFDGDAIAIEYPNGSLVAHRIPAEDDLAGPPFPLHAPAQLFTGYHNDPVDWRYLELEFTAVGRRVLRVEFTFVPGVGCLEALKGL